MVSKKNLFTAVLTFSFLLNGMAKTRDVARYVDPYIGTGDHGHVFLGAHVPFGAVQAGPNNYPKGWDWCSGYHYSDSILIGFAQTHLSGTGCSDLGDVLVMPFTGKIVSSPGTEKSPLSGWAAKYSHSDEKVKPGYYSIRLRKYDLKTEITATERVAFYKYTFPASQEARIGINLALGVSDSPVKTHLKKVDATTYTGYRFSRGWANDQRLFFAVRLSKAAESLQLFNNTEAASGTELTGKEVSGVLSFKTKSGETILMKIGISPVSEENALANIDAEIPDWNFNAVSEKAYSEWNKELNRANVESANQHRLRIFYTALYHSFTAPVLFNDHNGDYRGTDKKAYKNPGFQNYTTFSLWDTYRAAHPMYTILQPERVPDMVQSMLTIYNQLKPRPTKVKKNLNLSLSLRSNSYKRTADTLATKRDSAYWKDIRNVPLNRKEIESFAKRDSIQSHLDSLRKKKADVKFKSSDIFSGGQIGGDSTKWTLNYGGMMGMLRDYNLVDGLALGQKLSVARKLGKENKLLLAPEIYYTTARKSLAWKTDIGISYAPMRIGKLTASFGDAATDFNPEGPIRLNNAISSLIFQKNLVMFYRKKYAEISNQIDLANGLRLSANLAFARRSPLENNATFALFKQEKNITENLQSPEFSDLASYSIGLEYTPEYYYTLTNGQKEYQYSRFPTLKLRYSEGFSSIWSNNARFRKLDAYLTHQVQTSLFSSIRYELNGGAFLGNTTRLNLADYKFFDTSGDIWFTQKSPLTTFMLLNPYTSATNDYWFSTKVGYRSKYIVLKYLPFLQGKLFNESLQLKYLHTPSRKNYMEAGYYLDFFKLMNVGVNVSFDKMKYESWGIRLAIPLQLKNGKI